MIHEIDRGEKKDKTVSSSKYLNSNLLMIFQAEVKSHSV